MRSHLTLRLPSALVRALARSARSRGVPKSVVVREAVAQYLAAGGAPAASTPRRVTGRELATLLASLPRLADGDAVKFAEDLASARAELTRVPLRDPWRS
jgi:hypothetical protein